MRVAWRLDMTAGWGESEVLMDVSSRRLALVQHRHLPAHGGLLSFLSLLRAFLLNAIKRNQAQHANPGLLSSPVRLSAFSQNVIKRNQA